MLGNISVMKSLLVAVMSAVFALLLKPSNGQMAVREVTDPQTKNIFNISAYPIYNERQELYGMVVYITDITARRRMESQLYQSEN